MPRTLPIAAALLALPHLLAIAASRNETAVHADKVRAAFTGQGTARSGGCLRGEGMLIVVRRGIRPALRFYSQR